MVIHEFKPQVFHRTIGAREPVLSVWPGDTVRTWTVDNAGRDSNDREITPAGNPQTGPFYIEGAEPGDTLAVRFDRLMPNRQIGRTRVSLAPSVLDPRYVAESQFEDGRVDWLIDAKAGTATLSPTRSGDSDSGQQFQLTLTLQPMLGCFGTAPARGQYLSTSTSSTNGGNMDYRGFAQGVTVYLPVYEEGALFHLGDGHAVQGDGEITGTGIEVSFDVEFTVNLIKERTIGWPRAENDDYMMTVGNARPLEQALQHATTEMVKWLEELGLQANFVSTLLGQCVEYDIGNVFDPAYTMVCKIKKKLLSGIGLKIGETNL